MRLVVSPLVAGLAVGIGVPILLFYVYGVVPVSLCRAGGCAGGGGGGGAGGREGGAGPSHARFDDEHHGTDPDAASRRLEPSIGDASLSATSQAAEARAPSLAALAGSLGGHEAASPAPLRLEVTADVADTASAASATSAASWPDEPSAASRSARLRSLFLYGSPAPPPDPEAGTSAPPDRPDRPDRPEVTAACETRARPHS